MPPKPLPILVLALALCLPACTGVTPVPYTPTDEIKAGPGLLSGEDGEFTLFRR